MRRISLALALIGAVGCGQTSTSNTGGGRGTGPGTFTITIQNGQGQLPNPVTGVVPLKMLGGSVTAPGGINCFDTALDSACSVSYAAYLADGVTPNSVTLTAVATAPNVLLGWAGDCVAPAVDPVDPATGLVDTTCVLSGPGDKYVLAMFGPAGSGPHPNWSAGALHGPQYFAFNAAPTTYAWKCTTCHGATLTGQGLAPSCGSCHAQPSTIQALNTPFPEVSGSVNDGSLGYPVASGHWAAAGHNSGTSCPRCHTTGGFRDYLGLNYDGTTTDDHLAGYVAAAPAKAAQLQGPAYGRPVNDAAHPTYDPATQPIAGTYYSLGADNALGGVNITNGAQNADFWAFTNGFACDGCHNPKTSLGGGGLNAIAFPSFARTQTIVGNLDGTFAICGQCHTTVRDDRNIATVAAQLTGVTDVDAQLVPANNKTVRPHYLGAASTFLGEEAGVYFQYPGAVYTARNEHGGLMSCATCHDVHTGSVVADADVRAKCGSCHFNEAGASVSSFLEIEDVRQFGFEGDIDGDVATTTLKADLDGLKAKLLAAIQSYATNVSGTAICIQLSPTGLADEVRVQANTTDVCGTGANATAYTMYTARLLKAVFNYMAITNDPGAWAHNPRYAVEIVYDSIADLNQGLVLKTFAPVANGKRGFKGHFGAIEDPSPYAAMFYHGGAQAGMTDVLPPMGFTSNDCYQCHGGAKGFAQYLKQAPAVMTNAMTDANKVTALQCSTCHYLDGADMKGLRVDVGTVYVPPQKAGAADAGQVAFDAANLPKSFAVCGTCHSGRENGATITKKIGTKAFSTPRVAADFSLSSTNPHYLGAAGMMLGNNAKVLFQYTGKSYSAGPAFWKAGTNGNAPGPHGSPHGAECTGCHQPKDSKHEFGVNFTYCGGCHTGQYALAPIEDEYNLATAELYTAMQTYVTANLTAVKAAVVAQYQKALTDAQNATPVVPATVAAAQANLDNANVMTNICFNGGAYPYWYVYTTTCSTTGYSKMDDKLLKASFNYMWTQKEPGAWAHNEFYVFQAMYDSIEDLGGTPSFAVKAVTLPYPSTQCDSASPLNRKCP